MPCRVVTHRALGRDATRACPLPLGLVDDTRTGKMSACVRQCTCSSPSMHLQLTVNAPVAHRQCHSC
eukprot:3209933-Alexandrium_andersonii.AAC.1